jgi:hypothetical protein
MINHPLLYTYKRYVDRTTFMPYTHKYCEAQDPARYILVQ